MCMSVLTVSMYVLRVYAWCLRSQKSFRSLRHGVTSACKFVIKSESWMGMWFSG